MSESRGLNYLLEVRSEAMQHLLAFFKESGRHLEPKTRFLISVVTKVINFSPRGLRQYIKRAMEEGATRDEIIDTILCAYPAAGLTKVADAMDVFLAMDISEEAGQGDKGTRGQGKVGVSGSPILPVSLSEGRGEEEWVTVAKTSEIADGMGKAISVHEKAIALFNIAGTFYAIDNTCLHQGGNLGEGKLEGRIVTCPRHGWQFDVTDGHSTSRPGRAVRAYEVNVDGEEIRIRI